MFQTIEQTGNCRVGRNAEFRFGLFGRNRANVGRCGNRRSDLRFQLSDFRILAFLHSSVAAKHANRKAPATRPRQLRLMRWVRGRRLVRSWW